eukprot:8836968-Heterocapsa_arctica.AAC.1
MRLSSWTSLKAGCSQDEFHQSLAELLAEQLVVVPSSIIGAQAELDRRAASSYPSRPCQSSSSAHSGCT